MKQKVKYVIKNIYPKGTTEEQIKKFVNHAMANIIIREEQNLLTEKEKNEKNQLKNN